MKIKYIDKRFTAASLAIIAQANKICEEYYALGYDLTLRQLYYQFVSRGIIPNNEASYQRLGVIINDARMAGLLDWKYIVDRTRNLRGNAHRSSPEEAIKLAAKQYKIDKWSNQGTRVEVWVEKDALSGIVADVSLENDCNYFACRGYISVSEMHSAADRHIYYKNRLKQDTVVLYLGDHDPSGIDMTRDIKDRLYTFGATTYVERIALNMDQVEQYNPPPNPAKITDTRATGYISTFGNESWELDALNPTVLTELIDSFIKKYRDNRAWAAMSTLEADQQATMLRIAENYDEVIKSLDRNEEEEYDNDYEDDSYSEEDGGE